MDFVKTILAYCVLYFFMQMFPIVFKLLSFLYYHYRCAVHPAMQLWGECDSLLKCASKPCLMDLLEHVRGSLYPYLCSASEVQNIVIVV